MVAWISLAVLSALAVSTLSLPGPDGAYNIPNVGTGRRSQYYVLHSDGTYKYGHDTGEGAFESARLKRPGKLEGEFGYTDPDGNPVNVEYKSGDSGFVARGNRLPEPHPDFNAAHAEARARPPFVDPLADSDTDASYSFQFAGDESSRTEVSDSDGNVRGSYTVTDEDGNTRTYTYTAGRGIGFVIEGDDLPQSPETPGETPAATRLTSSTNRLHSGTRTVGSSSAASRFTSSTNRLHPGTRTAGSSSAATRFTASTNRLHSGTRTVGSSSTAYRPSSGSLRPRVSVRPSSSATVRASSTASQTAPDGSYAFTYNAGDHSRSETADSNLNVDGQFSFTADDGITRRVEYAAGSNRGFQATGDHLPTPPESHFGTRTASTSTVTRQHSNTFTRPRPSFTPSATLNVAASPRPTPRPTHRRRPSSPLTQTYQGSSSFSNNVQNKNYEEANTRSEVLPGGGYAFAYETSSHSRAESGDRDNNVAGNFEFVADDDGQRRKIDYEAGSSTGFIAEGAHIPVGPEVPGAPSGQPTGRIVPVQEVPFVDPLADTGTDASYNFAFDSDQYSRSEAADSEGNVQGTYSVTDEDGTRRTYRFRAGKGVGFETEEVSRTRGAPLSRPSPSSSAGSSTSFRGTGSSTSSTSSSLHGAGSRSSSFRGAGSSHASSSVRGTGSSSSFRGTGSSHGSSSFSGTGSTSSFRGASGTGQRTTYSASSATSHSSASPSKLPLRSSFTPTSTQELFPGFQLHQYDQSNNPDKFGYVLTFDS